MCAKKDLDNQLTTNVSSSCKVFFSCNDNRLEGNIPSEIGNLYNMTRLQMQNNQFSGTIPHTFERLNKMEQFLIEGNKLAGTIPPGVCDLTQDYLTQFIVDCYSPREKIGFECDGCCTVCRDLS